MKGLLRVALCLTRTLGTPQKKPSFGVSTRPTIRSPVPAFRPRASADAVSMCVGRLIHKATDRDGSMIFWQGQLLHLW